MSLVCFVRRKDGWDVEEFHRYWREEHGPLVVAALGRHLVRYEQHHRRLGDYGRDDMPYDGMALLTFASDEAFGAFLSDPAYAAVAADEETFLDRAGLLYFFSEAPDVLMDAPAAADRT